MSPGRGALYQEYLTLSVLWRGKSYYTFVRFLYLRTWIDNTIARPHFFQRFPPHLMSLRP
jgi:hypothetical protein